MGAVYQYYLKKNTFENTKESLIDSFKMEVFKNLDKGWLDKVYQMVNELLM